MKFLKLVVNMSKHVKYIGFLLFIAGCSINNGGCDTNANCNDSTGAVQCACKDGYLGDGITCTGI